MDTLLARESATRFNETATGGRINEFNERRFYSPEHRLEQLNGYGNPGIHRVLELIRPVAAGTDMLQVLDIFRDYQQEHFFPVLDAEGRPAGLVCERSLKSYVYSRFGLALLANRSQVKVLEHFLSPCPSVEIDATTEQVLQAAHQIVGAEGVLVTAQGCYVGFIRASSLVELAHAQRLETVHQHNLALDQKNREIQAVLQNMRQGICTILPDMTLHADHSTHLVNILERTELAYQSVMQVLFSHADAGPDQLQQIEAALMAVLDQDELMYSCNAHLLPTELNCTFCEQPTGNHHRKVLELHWSPITNSDGLVVRLMLVVRDISQIRQLQQQTSVQQRELQLLGEILNATERRFRRFMQSSAASLLACHHTLEQWRTDDIEESRNMLATLYRHLHTVKGNARTLGLNAVTDSLHQAEQILQIARESGSVLNGEQMRSALQQVETDFLQYRELYESRLQGFGSTVHVGRNNTQTENFRQLFENLTAGIAGVSAELGKPCPQIEMTGDINKVTITEENFVCLESVMTHIIRNSLDHGIESAQDRQVAGKPEKGTITVHLASNDSGALLTIADDGRGLALAKLRVKAQTLGLLAAECPLGDDEVAELIFHSGLSTTEQTSMISGRGVGMDAVRSALAGLGAGITVKLLGSSPVNPDYCPFQLCINLPGNILIKNWCS